ncbi:MAG: helix-turn-helix transcriptional regulator [Clostridia bacterium]|nr:helix-turn-helix transcriptional regulator [Clostridia bacterium]
MQYTDLLSARPLIVHFQRAVGAALSKNVYHQFPKGRPYDVFAYILFGEATYDFGDYAVKARAGDLLYLPYGSSYTLTVHSERYGFLYASFSFVQSEKTVYRAVAFHAPSGKPTENLFHKILSTWQMQSPTVREECLSLLYSIYADLLTAGTGNYLPSNKRQHMEQATAFIRAHLADETLAVKDIAAAVHLSESHFRRLFKEAHNMSPVEYINMLRITEAKELLKNSDHSLTEIAAKCGFSSIYYFSLLFKKEVNCTPSEYRKTRRRLESV